MVRNLNDSTERVPIGSIEPHPNNPNRGDVAGIRSSIETVGWFGFVTCQKSTRRILIGEHRWLSLQAEGETEIDVLWLDVGDEAAVEVMIADNEWARRGRNDRKSLYSLLVGIMDRHETVEHVGVRDEEFDVLKAEMRDLVALEQRPPPPWWTPPIRTATHLARRQKPAQRRSRFGNTTTPKRRRPIRWLHLHAAGLTCLRPSSWADHALPTGRAGGDPLHYAHSRSVAAQMPMGRLAC